MIIKYSIRTVKDHNNRVERLNKNKILKFYNQDFTERKTGYVLHIEHSEGGTGYYCKKTKKELLQILETKRKLDKLQDSVKISRILIYKLTKH